jgi:hypothetical protein
MGKEGARMPWNLVFPVPEPNLSGVENGWKELEAILNVQVTAEARRELVGVCKTFCRSLQAHRQFVQASAIKTRLVRYHSLAKKQYALGVARVRGGKEADRRAELLFVEHLERTAELLEFTVYQDRRKKQTKAKKEGVTLVRMDKEVLSRVASATLAAIESAMKDVDEIIRRESDHALRETDIKNAFLRQIDNWAGQRGISHKVDNRLPAPSPWAVFVHALHQLLPEEFRWLAADSGADAMGKQIQRAVRDGTNK